MATSSRPPVRPQPGAQAGGRPQRRRSRVRTLLPLGIAAWVALEIWLFILVSDATNGFVVFLCILAGFVLGAIAVKRAGRSAWRNLTASMQRQGAPGAGGRGEGAAGAPGEDPDAAQAGKGRTGLHMLGGMLLIIPGFLSDIVALLLLFPPTRKLAGRIVDRTVTRRLGSAPAEPGSLGDLYQQAHEAEQQARMHRPDGKVIQGEVVDPDKRRD